MLRDTPTALASVECIAIGSHTLDLARGELLDPQGHPAGLRAQALKVLLVLGERLGQVVGKDELMRRVWGEVVVTEDSLVQAVGDIRRVLGAAGAEQLRTVPRRGYLLVATEPRPPAAPPVPDESQAPRQVRRAWGLAVAALGLAACWRSSSPPRCGRAPTRPPADRWRSFPSSPTIPRPATTGSSMRSPAT
jgi:DNA-binding winged helix-turn-helix (wHTH) protein